MTRLGRFVVAVFAFPLVGCSGSSEERVAESAMSASIDTAATEGVEEPPLVSETISIEGTREEIAARRFESPIAFPIGFTTVVPADMIVEFASTGEGDAIQFEAAFGGVREPEARLAIVVMQDGTDERAARSRISALGAAAARIEGRAWDLEAYSLEEGPGFIALGERNDEWFYLLASYPPEYGDGMAPRLDLILRRWLWSDGTPLIGA